VTPSLHFLIIGFMSSKMHRAFIISLMTLGGVFMTLISLISARGMAYIELTASFKAGITFAS
jgi:hypothetical protein